MMSAKNLMVKTLPFVWLKLLLGSAAAAIAIVMLAIAAGVRITSADRKAGRALR